MAEERRRRRSFCFRPKGVSILTLCNVHSIHCLTLTLENNIIFNICEGLDSLKTKIDLHNSSQLGTCVHFTVVSLSNVKISIVMIQDMTNVPSQISNRLFSF